MGLGRATQANSWGEQLGIGGYYLIIKAENILEEGKYETNLELLGTTSLRNLSKIERATGADWSAPVGTHNLIISAAPRPSTQDDERFAAGGTVLGPGLGTATRGGTAALEGTNIGMGQKRVVYDVLIKPDPITNAPATPQDE